MSQPIEPVTLSVQGMTCSSCVNTVEKALNKVEGVSATINFATETAHILAPADMNPKDLIKIVEKAGYSATLLVDAQSVTARRLYTACTSSRRTPPSPRAASGTSSRSSRS